jgi:hypothetical protein
LVCKKLSSYIHVFKFLFPKDLLFFTAAGRSRELQGLARAIVKLWETSAIAKIAIKRGVPYTSNDRMAEELKVFLINR